MVDPGALAAAVGGVSTMAAGSTYFQKRLFDKWKQDDMRKNPHLSFDQFGNPKPVQSAAARRRHR